MILNTLQKDFLSKLQEPGVGHFPLDRRSRFQRGQATVEYVLLIGIAALLGLGFMSTFTPVLKQGILTFNVQLERELVGGGFDEATTAWEN